MVDYLLGGLAGCCAALVTNPLEVVKTRQQLQGELSKHGSYEVHYRNAFQALYTIGRNEGVNALQRGLTPNLGFQLCMNSFRIGIYQALIDVGLTRNDNCENSVPRMMVASAFAGGVGAFIASPFYLASFTSTVLLFFFDAISVISKIFVSFR